MQITLNDLLGLPQFFGGELMDKIKRMRLTDKAALAPCGAASWKGNGLKPAVSVPIRRLSKWFIH